MYGGETKETRKPSLCIRPPYILIPMAFDAGRYRFPFAVHKQKTGNCVQHQTFGEFDMMMVSNMGPIGNWAWLNRRMVRALPSG